MNKGLKAITEKTTELWNAVNEKYGNHKYTLGVNGKDEVVLSKEYGESITKGNANVQKALRKLLNA